MKIKIQQMIDDGNSFEEIQKEVQCSMSYIYKCNTKELKRTKEYDLEIIQTWQTDYNSGLSLRLLSKKHKVAVSTLQKYLVTRTKSEAAIIDQRNNPRPPHSDETRIKISSSIKKYFTDNPDKVPYLLNHYSKGPSYPEKYWKIILDTHKIDYVEQYQIGLYSLDFAVLDKKIDLEIDGEQHYSDKRIIDSDIRRTKYLMDRGWETIRIRWSFYQKLEFCEKEAFVGDIISKIGSIVQ